MTYPSASQLVGALAIDGAPEPFAVRLAETYAEIETDDLDNWCLATYGLLLSRGYRHAAMTVLCHPSDHTNEIYEKRAQEVLERVRKEA